MNAHTLPTLFDRSTLRIFLLTSILVLSLCRPAPAAPPLWWALDSMPPGTPPTIQCLPSSDPSHTMLDIVIHGFWYETIQQGQQTFRRLSLGKTSSDALYQVPGRPELPAIQHVIGDLVGGQVGPPAVQILDQTTIPGAQIYPDQMPYIENGPPPPFAWDQAFYQQTSTPYPPSLGAAKGSLGRMDGLDLLGAETYPFRVIPATQTLVVAKHYTVTMMHAGSHPPTTVVTTRRKAQLYTHAVANAPVISAYRPPNVVTYMGEYLIICGPTFEDEIQPLARQKRLRGYTTLVVTTLEAGDSCDEIRAYITDWWNDKAWADHYVLLVGDMGEIGTCPMPAHGSDMQFVCIDGLSADGSDDPYPEARLGRFPAITEQDVTDMVDKTLEYEDGYPLSGSWLDDVTLAAHKCAEPGECDSYKNNQEVVFSAAYSNPPSFTKRYGQDGATNAQIQADVNAGRGVLGYRGHGSTTAWTGWNNLGQYFGLAEVAALANAEKTPVVFSIACLNNDISGFWDPEEPESVGEKWMKTTSRAVAFFGAAGGSERAANNTLDIELFANLYDRGMTTLGELIYASEATMISENSSGEGNAWMYLLLGDPELEVWTEPPPPLFVVASAGPNVIVAHVSGGGSRSAINLPTVAVYKEGEIQAAYYADANGDVTIPIDPLTPGPVYVTAYTEIGSEGVAADTVMVTPTGAPDVAPSTEAALRLHAPRPNPAHGSTRVVYELPNAGRVKLSIVDVTGRSVTVLANQVEEAGQRVVTWDGRDAAGQRVSPGVYFVRLEQGGAALTQKLAFVR